MKRLSNEVIIARLEQKIFNLRNQIELYNSLISSYEKEIKKLKEVDK